MSAPAGLAILPIATGRETLAETWRLLRGRRAALLGVMILFALGSLTAVVVPYVVGAFAQAVSQGDRTALAPLLTVMVLAALVSGVLEWAAALSMARVIEPVLAGLRESFIARFLHLDLQRIERAGSGDVLSRATRDVSELSENAASVLPQLVSLTFTLVTVALALASLDLRFLLVAIVVLPLGAWTLRWYLRIGPRTYAAERAAEAELGRHVIDTARARRTVQAFGIQGRQRDRVRAASWARVRWAVRTRIVTNILRARIGAMELLGLLATFGIGTAIALTGGTGIGVLTTSLMLFARLMEPIAEALMLADEVQAAASALARVVGVTRMGEDRGNPSAAEDPAAAGNPAEASPSAARETLVALEDVRFAYTEGPEVIGGVSLQLEEGRRTALVGATGSGKSTLAALVSGDLVPASGRRRSTLPAARIATVVQTSHVFATTLRENLTLGAPKADDAQIRAAIDRLGAGRLLDACEDGLDTSLGRHEHPLEPALSQLLALVRLELADPRFVILDEATAEAGSADAEALEEAALAVVRDRAGVIVAHRLSQVRSCEQIAVMEGGRIIERGGHEELLAAGGRYAELWEVWSARG